MAVFFEEHEYGFSWIPEEPMQRTSHALATGDGVWLVDPVDVPEALERAAALGPAAGVIQLLDRHNRDAAALARRLSVPHLRVPPSVPGSPFEVIRILDLPIWREVALWWPRHRVLVVAELVGTTPIHALGEGPAGMHPAVRALPPRAIRGYQPEHLLVGHGPGVHGDAAAAALADAYARSRRDLPRFAAKAPVMLKALRGAR